MPADGTQPVRASVRDTCIKRRFKAFPIQDDDYFYTVPSPCRAQSARAGLPLLTEDWVWGSAWGHRHRNDRRTLTLCKWPAPPRVMGFITLISPSLTPSACVDLPGPGCHDRAVTWSSADLDHPTRVLKIQPYPDHLICRRKYPSPLWSPQIQSLRGGPPANWKTNFQCNPSPNRTPTCHNSCAPTTPGITVGQSRPKMIAPTV